MAEFYTTSRQGKTDLDVVKIHPMTTSHDGRINVDLIPDWDAGGNVHTYSLSLDRAEVVHLISMLSQRLYALEINKS